MSNYLVFIDNFTRIIGFSVLFFCSTLIYYKAYNIIPKQSNKISLIILNIFLPCISLSLRYFGLLYYEIFFIILSILSLALLHINQLHNSFIISVIAVGISYGVEALGIIIISTFLWVIQFTGTNYLSIVLSDIFDIIVVMLLIKSKRFRKGFSFLEEKENLGIGLFISGLIIMMFSVLTQSNNIPDILNPIILIGISIALVGIILWIKRRITLHYRKRLKLRAEEYSKIELAEKEKDIKKLSDENTSLSSIIHLDNHIIQSIESELKALNSTELTDKLLTSINQRNEYVNDLLIKSKNLASTGNADIDAVLLDLYIKSASRGIDYNLSADCDINYLLNNIITKDDIETLLRNTITTSIVDIENKPEIPGRISIKISQPNDIYELTVMDNGISKENNNSISDIIEKSNASILINKFDNNDSFTKSVTIRFDGMK
jgi:hypothetical protein